MRLDSTGKSVGNLSSNMPIGCQFCFVFKKSWMRVRKSRQSSGDALMHARQRREFDLKNLNKKRSEKQSSSPHEIGSRTLTLSRTQSSQGRGTEGTLGPTRASGYVEYRTHVVGPAPRPLLPPRRGSGRRLRPVATALRASAARLLGCG